MAGRRYCVISPCRDEAKFLRAHLTSVAAQTVLPVALDHRRRRINGRDARDPRGVRRGGILGSQVVRREDRGARKVGPGVVDAFYEGYRLAEGLEWDYVCKLDMDLDLPPGTLRALMRRMEADPRLGSASGQAYFPTPSPANSSSRASAPRCRSATSKFYRRRCFEQIGGIRAGGHVGRDRLPPRADARVEGARAFDDPETRFIHLRPMGSSHRGSGPGGGGTDTASTSWGRASST